MKLRVITARTYGAHLRRAPALFPSAKIKSDKEASGLLKHKMPKKKIKETVLSGTS
jgi:hypothetical protein